MFNLVQQERLTDIGSRSLLNMQHLRWLNIYVSAITDKSVREVLSQLPALEHVEVTSTDVTQSAIERLKQNRPKVNVIKYR